MAHYLRRTSLLPALCSLAVALLVALSACENPDSSAVLAVQTTGVVRGFVFFDANGDGEPTPADTGIDRVRVQLVVPGGTNPVATAVSDTGGRFRMAPIPVGRYGLVVDTTTVPGGLVVLRLDSSVVVSAGDSVAVNVAVGVPPPVSGSRSPTTVRLSRCCSRGAPNSH